MLLEILHPVQNDGKLGHLERSERSAHKEILRDAQNDEGGEILRDAQNDERAACVRKSYTA